MAKNYVPIAAGAVALSLVGGGIWAASAFATTPVSLSVDGEVQQLDVRASTVQEVLDQQSLTIGEHDMVQPAADTPITNDLVIAVRFARPLKVTQDGVSTTYWTTAANVGDALNQLKLATGSEDKISISRSLAIGREGLELTVATAKKITLTAGGQPTELTVAGTVGDALTQAGITADADDVVTPSADTALTDGASITYQKVDVKTQSKTVELPFEKKTEKSDSMYADQKKVTTKGVKGQATQQVQETYTDGKLTDTKVVSTETTKAPVAEVTTVGTKSRPSSKSSSKPSTSVPSSSSSSGSSSSNVTPAKGASCQASYYWQGQRTANGEWFNTNDFTAAHKSLPFNTRVKVTNLANGKTTVVRINDRGPYIAGRCLDLSRAAMSAIGGTSAGVVKVAYEVV